MSKTNLSMSGSEVKVERRRSDSARAKGRETLTRADIINAAARLLESGGVQTLSMRSLARALGTGSSTLYWHVRDQKELLLALVDDTFASVRVPENGSWQERLTEMLLRCHDALATRPALVEVLWGAGWDLGPEALRVANSTVELLAESGLPVDEISDNYIALITLVYGFVSAECATADNTRYSDIRADDNPRPDKEPYPALARYGPGAEVSELRRQARYAIERFVAGIDQRSRCLIVHPGIRNPATVKSQDDQS